MSFWNNGAVLDFRQERDALDRLNREAGPANTQSSNYDANGNRTGLTVRATQSTYSYPATSNRLASISGGTTDNIGYDTAGHLIGEYEKTGAPKQETISLGDTPIALIQGARCTMSMPITCGKDGFFITT